MLFLKMNNILESKTWCANVRFGSLTYMNSKVGLWVLRMCSQA